MRSALKPVFRRLFRRPLTTLSAVLVLAVGLAAVTLVFALWRGVSRALPYPRADRLVLLANTRGDVLYNETSYRDARDWRERLTSLAASALVMSWDSVDLQGPEGAERVRVAYVSAEYFELLGSTAARGRSFAPEETTAERPAAVALLSHALWQSRFGADPEVVGRTIKVNHQPCAIVGVMPEGFHDLSDEVRLWLPLPLLALTRDPSYLEDRGLRVLGVLGRLAPGVSVAAARFELASLTRELEARYPETNRGYGGTVLPLFDFLYRQEKKIRNVERSLALLGAGALALLLLGCVSLAQLQLADGWERTRETALRQALGCGRLGWWWPFALETLAWSLAAGLLGAGLARGASAGLLRAGAVDLPDFVAARPDGAALGLCLALAVALGLVLASVGARASRRRDLRAALTAGAGASSRRRTGGWLIAAELALTLPLLFATLELAHAFERLHATGLGFATDRLLTFEVLLSAPRYDPRPARVELAETLRAELAALPGVAWAGIWGAALPGVGGGYIEVADEARPPQRPEDVVQGINHHLSPGALRALGIPILAGRDLLPTDTAEQPVVAVVGATLADKLWPGENPIGKRFQAGPGGRGLSIEVVGLAPDVRHGRRLDQAVPLDFYLAYAQRPVRNLGFALLADVTAAALLEPVRARLRRLDPDLALANLAAARDRLAAEEAPARLAARVLGLATAAAALIAGLGIHGVVAAAVARRTRELGVRRAVGAGSRAICGLLVRSVALPLGVGAVVGELACLALGGWLRGGFAGVEAGAPSLQLAAAALGALLVAAAALWLPLRRALRIAPADALRCE